MDEKPATGTLVTYVPWYAEGDRSNTHCQDGVVSNLSVFDDQVFVRYHDSLSPEGQLTPIKRLVLR